MALLSDIGSTTVNDALAKLDPLSKALIVGLIQGETTAGSALIAELQQAIREEVDHAFDRANELMDRVQIAARKVG